MTSGSRTHFLPGSSEGGHVWLGALLSGSCLPGTPSFSVKVEKNQDHEWTMNFFSCIFRLLSLNVLLKCRITLKFTVQRMNQVLWAYISRQIYSSAHIYLQYRYIFHCFSVESAECLASFKTSEKPSCISSPDRVKWKCTSLTRHRQLNEQSVLTN